VVTPSSVAGAGDAPSEKLQQCRSFTDFRRTISPLPSGANGRGRPRRTWTGAGRAHEQYILDIGFHFGEWLRPGESALASIRGNLIRPPAIIATAYFAHSTRVLAQAAEVLDRTDDAARYRELSEKVREAWRFAFVHDDGRIGPDRQDDYVRALAFDLLLPEQRPAAVGRLVELIEQAGDHLTTGFLSTAMLLPELIRGGRTDVAMRLLSQTTNPSWLYQVEHGATTVWETWEGSDANGRAKESHNHYALGAITGWLVEGLAGLAPAAPGYRRIRIAPTITDRPDYAGATLDTPFGLAASRWQRAGGVVTIDVTVPAGTVADVVLPGDTQIRTVGSGEHSFTLS
jgi:alpha-L-rhamnosidase